MRPARKLIARWTGEGGYREVLLIAVPLLLTTSSHAIQHFVDRMFLTWYSADTLAAAMPAGMVFFTLASLFIGTVGYANTFVAQYVGAGRPQRVGPSLWQSFYLALAAGLLLAGASLVAEPFFAWVGHAPRLQRLEADYFRVLCWGGGWLLVSNAAACFYTGRGKTWPVLWINAGATAVNLVLDYAWIFGRWGFPEWGIRGAALATVVAHGFSAVVFVALVMRRHHREVFATLHGWRPERELFLRLLRYGLPSGLQFFIDMTGFTAIVLLVGRLGGAELAATNIAFNINMVAFMPMIGFGIATSTLTGRYLGRDRPEQAARSTWSAYHMSSLYMIIMSLAYVVTPGVFLWPFERNADPAEFARIAPLAVILLRFVALYSVFDAMNIVFASTLKGAGDTRFVMAASLSLCWTVMVIPAYVASEVLHWGLYGIWAVMTVYVVLLGFVFLIRFLGGKWRAMRVIEPSPAPVMTAYPEVPAVEIES